MRPMSVTVGSATASTPIPLDHYISPFNLGLGVSLSVGADLTYTVQHTFDDVWDPNFNAATAKWFNHATMASKTTSFDGNYAYPIMAVRLLVSGYTSGTATLTIIQAGMPNS